MNILITGGLGFQGRHLAKRLISLNHHVTLLTTRAVTQEELASDFGEAALAVKVVTGDILDEVLMLSLVEVNDVVFHLAGKVNPRESLSLPEEYMRVNVWGTVSVLEAVRAHQKRLFFVSSCAVYGDGSFLKSGETFNENSPLLPADPYAASKVAADRMCYAYHKSFGLDITIVRPFTTYGPGQRGGAFGGLISVVVERASRGEKLAVFGDGSAVRDFLYIDDLIDAYILLLETPNIAGEVFNVASSVETPVIEVVKYVADKFKVEIEYKPANENEVKRYAADITKIKQLGYVPKVTIQEGMERYIKSLT